MKIGSDFVGVGVIYFCHDGNGNFLFQKRSKNCRDEHGRWDCGGGAVEFGHTLEQTLSKEIKEEYGVDVLDFEFLGFRDVHREEGEKKTHWIMFDFKVLVDREKVINGEPHKFDDFGWFTLDNLPDPVHSQMYTTLDRYLDKLN